MRANSNQLNLKVYLFVGILLVLQFFFLLIFSYFQGSILESAFNGSLEIISLVTVYLILSKLAMVFISSGIEYIKEMESIKALDNFFYESIPSNLKFEIQELYTNIHYSFQQVVGKFYIAQFQKFSIILESSIYIFGLAFFMVYFDFKIQPFTFFISVLIIFLKEWFSFDKISNWLNAIQNDDLQFESQLKDYFDSGKEGVFNWNNKIYDRLCATKTKLLDSKKKLVGLFFQRDFTNGSFIELPYIFITLSLFYTISKQQLPLSMVFLYFSFFQGFVTSIRRLIQLKKINQEIKIYGENLEFIKSKIKDNDHTFYNYKNEIKKINSSNEKQIDQKEFSFNLMNGFSANLNTNPGVCFVRGANGSGKSTLIETLIGYRKNQFWNQKLINSYQEKVNIKGVRIVEKNPVVLAGVQSLEGQIFCYENNLVFNNQPLLGLLDLEKNMSLFLSPELTSRWISLFNKLKISFESRKSPYFSEGEKVILSFARVFSYPPESINLLIIDESDSALDEKTRNLFHESVFFISKKASVVWMSHNDFFIDKIQKSNRKFELNLLGVSDIDSKNIRHNLLYKVNVEVKFIEDKFTEVEFTEVKKNEISIDGEGMFFEHLKAEFKRIITILNYHNIDTSKLYKYKFYFKSIDDSSNTKFKVKIGEFKSVSLSLLLVVKSILEKDFEGYDTEVITASGVLDADGTIRSVRDFEQKSEIAKQINQELIHVSNLKYNHIKQIFLKNPV